MDFHLTHSHGIGPIFHSHGFYVALRQHRKATTTAPPGLVACDSLRSEPWPVPLDAPALGLVVGLRLQACGGTLVGEAQPGLGPGRRKATTEVGGRRPRTAMLTGDSPVFFGSLTGG